MVNYRDGILTINGRAYVSIDNKSLISRIIATADNIYSTQIILSRLDVNAKLLNELNGKYWLRAQEFDTIKHVSYAINENRRSSKVASL